MTKLTLLPHEEQKMTFSEQGIVFTDAAKDALFDAWDDTGVLRIGAKGGGCIHPDQEVGMYDGTYKKASEVKQGDVLVSCEGKSTTVMAIYNNSTNELLKLIPTIGRTHNVMLTPDHKVFTQEKGFTKAANVSIHRKQSVYRDTLSIVYPSAIQDIEGLSFELCKVLGYFVAEGSITFKKNKKTKKIKAKVVEFYSGKHETELNTEILSLLEKLNLKGKIRETRTAHCISVYNTAFATLVEHFCGCNSEINGIFKEKRLHQDMITLPIEKQKAFLDFYQKGDGSSRLKSGNLEQRSCSTLYNLSRQLEVLICRIGFFPSFVKSKTASTCVIEGRVCNKAQSYELAYNSTGTHKYKNGEGSYLIKAKSAEKISYVGPTIDFSCFPHEAYSAGGILIHNCSGLSYLLDFIPESDVDSEEDMPYSVFHKGKEIKLVLDIFSAQYLKGMTIDYVKSLQQTGFSFNNPNASRHCGCGKSFSA